MAEKIFERIEEKIRALSPAGFELTEVREEGWEFYFIRHALDQNRVTDVTKYQVKLFKTIEGGFLGSASGEIVPTATEEEIDAKLAMIYTQAGFIRNPYYELNQPAENADAQGKTEENAIDVAGIAANFLKAVHAVPETAAADINSYELFVKKITRHFKNSNGVEYTAVYPSSMLEVVVNARKEGHEIELYRMYTSGGCDAESLRQQIMETLQYGVDRLKAEPTPNLKYGDVVFSTDDALSIYRFFLMRTNAAMKVRRISSWEKGQKVTERKGGDPVTVRAVRELPNSSRNMPFDDEGAPVREMDVIRDDVCMNFWGNEQFSYYLNRKAGESFNILNAVVDGGSRSAEEVRSGDYIEVVEFSDFQVDPIAGDIAGEIRLGYLHRNGEVTIVTGGSITGSMEEAQSTMEFSSEQRQYDNMLIPAVTKLKDLRITGIEE